MQGSELEISREVQDTLLDNLCGIVQHPYHPCVVSTSPYYVATLFGTEMIRIS